MRLVTFERTTLPRGRRHGPSGELGEAFRGLEDFDEPARRGPRIGAQLAMEGAPSGGDCILDLQRALALRLATEDHPAPDAEAEATLPSEPLAFLRRFPTALTAARECEAFVRELAGRFPFEELERAGALELPDRIRLLAPVPRPGKVVAVARNYAAHAEEVGGARPEEPVLFLKAPTAAISPGAPIVLPPISGQVDYEGELAVVIGRTARRVRAAAALEYVAGYTAANDVSARDWQGVRGQHYIGKSFDTFLPFGPCLVTRDEIPDPQDLLLRTRLSGEVVQSARTSEMTFPVVELIAFASRILTLEPGDVLLTGTPAGVGKAASPPRFLRDGDVVEVEIERIGTLRNPVRGD
jgi:acylpyruvate hydrolase